MNSAVVKDCLLLTHPSKKSKPLLRFGHGSTLIGNNHVITVGGFGEQNGRHMRVTETVLVNTKTLQMCKVCPIAIDHSVEGL